MKQIKIKAFFADTKGTEQKTPKHTNNKNNKKNNV